jgi:hypothetical protein
LLTVELVIENHRHANDISQMNCCGEPEELIAQSAQDPD